MAANALFRYEPATGTECMQAIPTAVQILNSIADKIVENDIRQEALSKKRAVKLSMSVAFVTAFNNQVSLTTLFIG